MFLQKRGCHTRKTVAATCPLVCTGLKGDLFTRSRDQNRAARACLEFETYQSEQVFAFPIFFFLIMARKGTRMISDVVILDFQTMNFNLPLICNTILRYFYLEHSSPEGPIHDFLSISIDSCLKVNIKDVHSDGF